MTKQQRLVLVVSIMASMVSAIDGFIVNVALPAISKSLGGGLPVQQWTVDGYLLTLGALILIAGSLSDLFGRRKVLAVGLWGFGVTSLLCAIAPNGGFLVVSRMLQGIAGALLVPSSLALIISSFSGKAQSKAIGTWTAWFSVAALIGPLLGGVIVATTSWRWIFAVNVLPITVTLWLLMKLDRPAESAESPRLDVIGAILCALGLGLAVYALIEQPVYGWGSLHIWPLLLTGLALLVGFVWYERRTSEPMLPVALFRVRNFSAGNAATLAVYAGLSLSSFMLIITLQQVGGYSALSASLAMLPVTAIMFVLSSRFGALAGRIGPRPLMTAGPLVAACGFLLLQRVQVPVHFWSDLLPGILLFGLGLSMTVAPLTSAVLADVEPKHAGVASAVNNALARIAGLVAIAFVGVITGPQITISSFHRVLQVIAALLVAGGIISAIGVRRIKAADITITS